MTFANPDVPNLEAGAPKAPLGGTLNGRMIPLPLIWQHLPGGDALADTPLNPEEVVIQRVRRSLDAYHAACRAGAAPDYSGA